MKMTRMTSKQSGVRLVSPSSDREYLFEDMPKPSKPKSPDYIHQMREFISLSQEAGGLFRPVDAAKVLKITYGTIQGYLQLQKPPFEVVDLFGVRWITGRSIEERLLHRRSAGRPKVSP
jgi:hypothetical protein